MHTAQRVWQYFQQHRVASIFMRQGGVVLLLGAIVLGGLLGVHIFSALAQSPCAQNDQVYKVVSGDTLGAIAAHHNTSWQKLASYNHLANPNMIHINQVICIPGKAPVNSGPAPIKGTGNSFPSGQCTWYANERYHQLHGIYVPWRTQSDAWQWTDRARDFHWHISTKPSPGAIIDLQPWVQGAYSLGHVAVVERILSNGHVIASNLNWGAYYWQVTNVEFAPGPGVTFISF
jgi:LysM repeat protein